MSSAVAAGGVGAAVDVNGSIWSIDVWLYTQTFVADGGVAPYAFAVTGSLPTGMRWTEAKNGLRLTAFRRRWAIFRSQWL